MRDEKLEAIEKLEQLIVKLSSGFLNALPEDIETGIYYALNQIRQLTGAMRSYVLFLSPDGDFVQQVYFQPGQSIYQKENKVSDLPFSLELIERKPAFFSKENYALASKDYLEKYQINEGVILPLLHGRRLVGLFVLEASSDEVHFSQYTGQLVAISKILSNGLIHNQLERQLKSALAAAQEASSIKTDFLTKMSHEIRTPLTIIMGTVELLERKGFDHHDISDQLSMLKSATNSLNGLVNDILDLAKIEQGHLMIELLPVNLRELTHNVFSMFEIAFRKKNVKFSIDLAPEIPVLIETDPTRIRQILNNLVSNALKFTTSGEVQVQLGYTALIGPTKPGRLHIIVSDTGIGIPAERIPVIFETFTQVETGTTRKFGGTGLGLAICKQLTEILGGTITVESKGRGTTFTLQLPTREPDSAEITADAGSKEQPAPLPALNILLVEDQEDNIKLMQYYFQHSACQVDFARNGIQAVEMSQQKIYDLILMDIMMPELDGLEATRQIRNSEKESGTKRVPIIALSANSFQEDIDKSLKAGCDFHVSKPVNKNRLFAEIARLTTQPGASGL